MRFSRPRHGIPPIPSPGPSRDNRPDNRLNRVESIRRRRGTRACAIAGSIGSYADGDRPDISGVHQMTFMMSYRKWQTWCYKKYINGPPVCQHLLPILCSPSRNRSPSDAGEMASPGNPHGGLRNLCRPRLDRSGGDCPCLRTNNYRILWI